jgi:hypothetical protein
MPSNPQKDNINFKFDACAINICKVLICLFLYYLDAFISINTQGRVSHFRKKI